MQKFFKNFNLQDELVDVKPSKLWLAWVYRETGSEKSKKQLEHIFGREYKVLRVSEIENLKNV